jgi:hypothetical protein
LRCPALRGLWQGLRLWFRRFLWILSATFMVTGGLFERDVSNKSKYRVLECVGFCTYIIMIFLTHYHYYILSIFLVIVIQLWQTFWHRLVHLTYVDDIYSIIESNRAIESKLMARALPQMAGQSGCTSTSNYVSSSRHAVNDGHLPPLYIQIKTIHLSRQQPTTILPPESTHTLFLRKGHLASPTRLPYTHQL